MGLGVGVSSGTAVGVKVVRLRLTWVSVGELAVGLVKGSWVISSGGFWVDPWHPVANARITTRQLVHLIRPESMDWLFILAVRKLFPNFKGSLLP
jgi:predicted sugar kinase